MLADEESKIVATGYPRDVDLLTKRHLHRNTVFLPILGEWPRKSLPLVVTGEGQVATCIERVDLEAMLDEVVDRCGLAHSRVMTKAKLPSLITTPGIDLSGVLRDD